MADAASTRVGLVDSHCHLAGSEFSDDLDAVLGRARDAGVTRCFVILAADDEGELGRAARLASIWSDVRFSVGVHPHAAGAFTDESDRASQVVEAAMERLPDARAVGEIGLDYHYDLAPRGVQQDVFRAQLRLARRKGLPVVIHSRDAADDTIASLAAESAGEIGGVFHCFTGDRATARRVLDAGFHVSFSGILTFPRALELKEVARLVPLDRLLIETDSPYLAPAPHRGRRNEPAYVVKVAEVVAGLRGLPLDEIVRVSTENFVRLFRP